MHDTVTTTAGRVQGAGVVGGLVFRGTPFAAPPAGGGRFRPPRPPEPWSGLRVADRFGPICPQVRSSGTGWVLSALATSGPMSEDCLSLNVWTPAVDDAGRPVMVWIHGGGFRSGGGSSSLYDGTAFLRDDVVVVTINYRLQAFGFLFLDEVFPGAEATGVL